MTPNITTDLRIRLVQTLAKRNPGARVAIVGWSTAAIELAADPIFAEGAATLIGRYAAQTGGSILPLSELASAIPDVVVVAEDDGKEPLLKAVARLVPATTTIVIAGFGHFAFRDELFDRVRRDALIPSFANGYPNCLVHIYQCLRNARARGLTGVVAEFGMFKGGTTMLMSRFIEELGADWKVIGFDTFDGFPSKRSPLDMYAHPDCVFLDVGTLRAMFAGRDVEIVEGDVVETCARLNDERLVLSFVDTDNYTSANAILAVIADRTQVGGAIVFDHWTGVDRYLDTIGERIAAMTLAADRRYFNLHGTGVFLRQE
ncbi:TylF/MycF/NovP-related O-methyltransferase [uncultured Sphingomonas sp.]|uniref:TylF/MycF/NovP-related O-methyltransferase n=1 Tax=uncultured Sphingomonas sp. TaxID=158754 RepID=UPI0025E10E5C|nr:TylF/MycF/NovP-related O-methyltransferase [uncultured Sphingomonas sp.]